MQDKRLFSQLLRQSLAKRKRPPNFRSLQWRYPEAMERKYFAFASRYTQRLMSMVTKILERQYPLWLEEQKAKTDDAEALQQLNISMLDLQREILTNPEAQKGVLAGILDMGAGVSAFNQGQLDAFIRMAIGSPFHTEEIWREPMIRNWADLNYRLITTLMDKTITRVNTMAIDSVAKGRSWKEVRDMIERTGEVSSNHAKLIARDQIGKLNGTLTKQRNQDLGLDLYTWSTSRDERVRGRPGGRYSGTVPSHWVMEGKLCQWGNSSVMSTNGGESWVSRPDTAPMGIPGDAIQCRCVAIPYFDDIIAEGKAFLESGLPIEEWAQNYAN